MGWGQNTGPTKVRTGQVTLTTSPTAIIAVNQSRRRLIVTCMEDGKDWFLGDSTVTPTTGQLVVQGKGIAYTTEGCFAVYGCVATGELDVSYLSEDYNDTDD